MRWASFVSEEADLEVAVVQAAQEVRTQLAGRPADLLLVFVSDHHADDYGEIPGELRRFFRLPMTDKISHIHSQTL